MSNVDYEMACKMCFPGVEDIGQIACQIWVSKWKGRYHLFCGQGHDGDIIHTFRIKPYPDPTKGKTEATLTDDDCKKHAKAYGYTRKLFQMDPYSGYEMIKACRKAGYNPKRHGSNFNMWLFFRCGELIQEHGK